MTGFSVSVHGSQVAALSGSVPCAEVPCVPDEIAAGFLFQTSIFWESLCTPARKFNPYRGLNLAFWVS